MEREGGRKGVERPEEWREKEVYRKGVERPEELREKGLKEGG